MKADLAFYQSELQGLLSLESMRETCNKIKADLSITSSEREVLAAQIKQNMKDGGTPSFPISLARSEIAPDREYNIALPDNLFGLPFNLLGCAYIDGGAGYYFFLNKTRAIVRKSTSSLSGLGLFDLASHDEWLAKFPNEKGNGIDTARAVSKIVDDSQTIGLFDPSRIRGRGLWRNESGSVVLHAGSRLVINGETIDLQDASDGYIYPEGRELHGATSEVLSASKSRFLLDLCGKLKTRNPHDQFILAGWIITSMIAGALNWRPHIWITGSAGAGKTWVLKNIVRGVLGDMAVAVQSSTTSAGLRQLLRGDSLPVVFDEIEGNDEQGQQRIKNLMELVRASSSDGGGDVAKGSAGGSSITYSMRSAFCFASIASRLEQKADADRVSVIEIMQDTSFEAVERFAEIKAMATVVSSPAYRQSLFARAIAMVGTIRASADVFSKVINERLGSRRAADQYGALYAGAWSLTSDRVVTEAEADAFMPTFVDSSASDVVEEDESCDVMAVIMGHIVRVDLGPGRPMVERQVGELIRLIDGTNLEEESVTDNGAALALARVGIRYEGGYIIIANKNRSLLDSFKGTKWSSGYRPALLRIEGVTKRPTAVKFAGVVSKCVMVPFIE